MIRFFIASFLCMLSVGVACTRPGYSPKDMSPGEKIMRVNCRSCHVLPRPNQLPADQWPEFLSAHSEHVELSEKEIGELMQYLQNKD